MLILSQAKAKLPGVVIHPLQSAKLGFVENRSLFQLLCEYDTWTWHLPAQNVGTILQPFLPHSSKMYSHVQKQSEINAQS